MELFDSVPFAHIPGQLALDTDSLLGAAGLPRVIRGFRHADSCNCGCQWVAGERGTVVMDSDTPKLLGLERPMVYVAFPSGTVAYYLDELA